MQNFSPETTKQLLAFMTEATNTTHNYPQHMLSLFLKYFGFKKALFFPYLSNPIYQEPSAQKLSLRNVIAYNIPEKDMRAYTEYYYKVDIMSPKTLPWNLQSNKVLRIKDILSFEDYAKSEWATYMEKTDVHYQICIFLKHNNSNIASINFFRSREEQDFTDTEAEVLSFLSDFLSPIYFSTILSSAAVWATSSFDKMLMALDVGAVLLDSNLLVLKANPAARAISQKVMGSTPYSAQIFQKSYRYVSGENLQVQMLVHDYYISNLQGSFPVNYDIGDGTFSLHSSSFTAMDIMGCMKVYQLVLITKNSKSTSPIPPDEPLTKRENEVFQKIMAGIGSDDIAKELHMSIHTLRTHVSSIYKKYGVSNKSALILKFSGEK